MRFAGSYEIVECLVKSSVMHVFTEFIADVIIAEVLDALPDFRISKRHAQAPELYRIKSPQSIVNSQK